MAISTGMTWTKPLKNMVTMMTVAMPTMASAQFSDAMSMAVGASIRPRLVIIEPVTTGGNTARTRSAPTAITRREITI